jgi:adenosylhomocysteine nucleosidase
MSSHNEAPILVVAALSYELEGLTRATPNGLAFLETGEGVANAERHLDAWLAQNAARAVLSIGFAGALSSSLQTGEVVVSTRVRNSETQPDPILLALARCVQFDAPVRFGAALTSNVILWQAESKRALGSECDPNEVAFVDMESTAIAGVCGRRGVPFLIIRSISDPMDEDLPLNFNLYRNRDGRVDSKRVVKAALLRPSAFKGLLELRRRSRLCAGRLSEFIQRLVPLIG